jgi:hypothetical protein
MADYPSLWIRTISGTVQINDLGIIIDTTGRELIGPPGQGEFTYDELSSSDDLRNFIGNGNIQWSENGGTWTLSHQDAGDILSTYTLEDHNDMVTSNPHQVTANDVGGDNIIGEINTNASTQINQEKLDPDLVNSSELNTAISNHHAPTSADHDDRYATETELATGGQADVHWDNVNHKPALAAGAYDPVYARVVGIDLSSEPYPATTGMFYVDNQATPHLWLYSGATWDDLGIVSSDHSAKSRFINLSDGDESVFEWEGSWLDWGVPENAYDVNVHDDGDNKQAIYQYSTPDTNWKKIGDVDWNSTPLDEVYDDSPSLNKIINVDDGPVDLNQADTYAPQVFNEKTSKPSNNPTSGKSGIISVNNILYKWDDSRSKWLSAERKTIWFGIGNNGQKDRYLPLWGIIPALKSGARLLRNMTLVEITIDSENAQYADYKIAIKTNPTTWKYTKNINGSQGGQAIDINIDFNSGDIPILKMEPTSGKIDYPVVGLTFAYKV